MATTRASHNQSGKQGAVPMEALGEERDAFGLCAQSHEKNILFRYDIGRIRVFGVFLHFKYFALMMVEFSILVGAIYFFYTQASVDNSQVFSLLLGKSVLAASPFTLCFAGLGLYSSRQTLDVGGVLLRYLVASAIAFPILWGILAMLNTYVTVNDFLIPIAVSIFLLAGLRAFFIRALDSDLLKRRVLVLGFGEKAAFVRNLAADPNQRGFSLVDVSVDTTTAGALGHAIDKHRVNEVVVAFDDRRKRLPMKELLNSRLSGVSVVDALDFLERETGVIPFEHLQPSWLVFTNGFASSGLSRMIKRLFDILASALLILLTLPVTLTCALAIKLDYRSPGPVVYSQERVGLNGKTFFVLKFRSMRTDAEKDGRAQWAKPKDNRVTAVGGVLRRCRLDELPQLFNVLMGSMSLVGPRPERPVFVKALSDINELYEERHRVKPGVTGWAQLRFPYTSTEEDSIKKLQYDMYYLKNQSVYFDIYILLQTIEVVLFGKGAR